MQTKNPTRFGEWDHILTKKYLNQLSLYEIGSTS